MGHKGATVFSMSQPSPRGLFAPSNGKWATFQIGPFVLLQNNNFERVVKSATNLSMNKSNLFGNRYVPS